MKSLNCETGDLPRTTSRVVEIRTYVVGETILGTGSFSVWLVP